MISVLNSAMFITFFGLLLPIVIHLLSRKNREIRPVGSIQFFKHAPISTRRSIQFSDPLLFLLRCFILIIMTVMLSQLLWNNQVERSENWVLIDPQLSQADLPKELLSNQTSIRFLHSDFPDYHAEQRLVRDLPVWELVHRLKDKPIQQASIISYQYVDEFSDLMKHLPFQLNWIPIASSNYVRIRHILGNEDSLYLTIEQHTEHEIVFDNRTVPRMNQFQIQAFNQSFNIQYDQAKDAFLANNEPVPKIKSTTVWIDPTLEEETIFIEAAVEAIRDLSFGQLQRVENKSDAQRRIQHHPNIENKLNASAFFTHDSITIYLQQLPKFRTNESLSQDSFTYDLLNIIIPDDRVIDKRRVSYPDQISIQPNTKVENRTEAKPYLFVILLFSMIMERLLANRRVSS